MTHGVAYIICPLPFAARNGQIAIVLYIETNLVKSNERLPLYLLLSSLSYMCCLFTNWLSVILPEIRMNMWIEVVWYVANLWQFVSQLNFLFLVLTDNSENAGTEEVVCWAKSTIWVFTAEGEQCGAKSWLVAAIFCVIYVKDFFIVHLSRTVFGISHNGICWRFGFLCRLCCFCINSRQVVHTCQLVTILSSLYWPKDVK